MKIEDYLIAAEAGELSKLIEGISDKDLSEIRGLHAESLLHFLAVEGDLEAVELLIARGLDVDEVNRFGQTPLMDCVSIEDSAMVELLLRAGADPNFPDRDGNTALHHAFVHRVDFSIKNLLKKFGANEDLPNKYGETPKESET